MTTALLNQLNVHCQVQMGLQMCPLEDLSPLQRSLLPKVCFVTVVPAAFSFGLIHHHEARFGWSSRPRANIYFFHFQIIIHLHTKLLADGLIAHSAWCRPAVLSMMSFDSSLVSPTVAERLEWILQTGVLYAYMMGSWSLIFN